MACDEIVLVDDGSAVSCPRCRSWAPGNRGLTRIVDKRAVHATCRHLRLARGRQSRARRVGLVDGGPLEPVAGGSRRGSRPSLDEAAWGPPAGRSWTRREPAGDGLVPPRGVASMRTRGRGSVDAPRPTHDARSRARGVAGGSSRVPRADDASAGFNQEIGVSQGRARPRRSRPTPPRGPADEFVSGPRWCADLTLGGASFRAGPFVLVAERSPARPDRLYGRRRGGTFRPQGHDGGPYPMANRLTRLATLPGPPGAPSRTLGPFDARPPSPQASPPRPTT
jgi:hypothetical protein